MKLGRNKMIELLIDGQPKAHIITSNSGPGFFGRLSALIASTVDACFQVFGIGLAGTGAAHFVAPQPFEFVAKGLFPQDTRRWVYQNGVVELFLGLTLAHRRTRIVASVGFIAYLVFLFDRAIAGATTVCKRPS
ncbi:hypothetical protein [Mycobacteroides abscessus]|uniref:hypothetical protein n=1 Tax=Mycobacteroides abscessus TaxID=36809 RepID=UPI00078EDB54|nr:hypothetical protein [Mycobacteroides abscessus]AMU78143.1 hypothetical protein A3O06_14990 [Mycobacteroides abscessus]ANO27093.1 hypothetical protein BAB79_14985 [Mycobacteroides abscessus]